MTRIRVTVVEVSFFLASGLHAQSPNWRSEMEKGDAMRLAGNPSGAAELYRNAIKIFEQPRADPLALASAWNSLATMQVELNRPTEARQNFEHALAETEKAAGRNSVAFAQMLLSFSGNYVRQGQYAKAEQQIREAIAIMKVLVPSGSISLALARSYLSETLLWQKQYAEAGAVLEQAVVVFEKQPARGQTEFGMCLNNLGLVRGAQGRGPEAIRAFKEALSVLEAQSGSDSAVLLHVLNNLAVEELRAGNFTESAALFSRALQIADTHPNTAPVVSAILANYAHCLKKMGHKQEAKSLEARAGQARKERAISTGFGYTVDVATLRSK